MPICRVCHARINQLDKACKCTLNSKVSYICLHCSLISGESRSYFSRFNLQAETNLIKEVQNEKMAN